MLAETRNKSIRRSSRGRIFFTEVEIFFGDYHHPAAVGFALEVVVPSVEKNGVGKAEVFAVPGVVENQAFLGIAGDDGDMILFGVGFKIIDNNRKFFIYEMFDLVEAGIFFCQTMETIFPSDSDHFSVVGAGFTGSF